MINMQVINVFYLSLGGTTFVCKLSQEIPVIRSTTKYVADLIVDDRIYLKNIKINGEMIGGKNPDGHRAIVATEVLNLDSDFFKNHDCQLVLIESN
jgi:hypothetical protein